MSRTTQEQRDRAAEILALTIEGLMTSLAEQRGKPREEMRPLAEVSISRSLLTLALRELS